MRVRLHKAGREYFTDSQWSEIHDAIEFFINRHDITNVVYDLKITFFDDVRDYVGLFSRLPKLRYGVIQIKYMRDFDEVLNTLFHELTHLRQDIVGDLAWDPACGMQRWKGALYFSPDDTDYFDRPWEIEARQVADKMVVEWGKVKFNNPAYKKPNILIRILDKLWSSI